MKLDHERHHQHMATKFKHLLQFGGIVVCVIYIFIAFIQLMSVLIFKSDHDPNCVLMDDLELPLDECYWTDANEKKYNSLNYHNLDLM